MKRKIFLVCLITSLVMIFSVALASCSEELTPPNVEIANADSTKTSVSFEIVENDPDNIGAVTEIELWSGTVKIKTADSTEIRKFSDLDANTLYTVKVVYSYDLGDENGEVTSTETVDIKTVDSFSSKTDVRRSWEGKTLNIACSTWSGTPGAPWSVMELCIEEGKDSGFGTYIDKAVLEREKYIKEAYGVELNWINATRWSMQDALEQATLAENINYDLAMPRMMRAQQIVAGGYVYDLKDRDFIDFANPYYSKNSVDSYTAKGHTFFVAGDFSTLDKETAFVLYFNKTLLGGEEATKELYQKVRDGKWTWSELVTLASASYKDDGDGIRGDTDVYGLGTTTYSRYFEYFGVTQAGVNENTGEWEIAVNDSRADDIVSAIITSNKAIWCRSAWAGCWGGPQLLCEQGLLLFYNDVLQYSYLGENGDIGVVPFPMLNEEQGRYCVPCAYQQTVLMCIPKVTQDRAMSEYFLDVLAWTGNEYTMKAYIQQKSQQFTSEEDMEMLTTYILPNIVYDAGGAVGWGSLIGHARDESYNGNINTFDNAYVKYEPDALKTIAQWNDAWGAYTE
ncbi:MAG: hypothetical protein IJW19_00795 [Clostridia bacterium]|nr:hypothetical protein [Clostridia bacterium]